MSNPLLRPNDPRFQPRGALDEQGQNRFADPAQAAANENSVPTADNVFATAASNGEQPFRPRYETTQAHRGMLLLILAIVGLTGNAGGTLALSGAVQVAWVLPFLAMFPAGAAAFFAFDDLRAMRLGAMDASGLALTRIAFWMGVAGVACSALAACGLLLLAIGFWGGLD